MTYVIQICHVCDKEFQRTLKGANQSSKLGYRPTCKDCIGKQRIGIRGETGRRPITYKIDDNGCHIITSHTLTIDGYADSIDGLIHRVLFEKENGKLLLGEVVRHNCDNPSCINLKHLIKGTHQDNVADRVSRNRSATGEDNGRSKLTWVIVEEIRKSPLNSNKLAHIYKVSPKAIRNVRNGITWVK